MGESCFLITAQTLLRGDGGGGEKSAVLLLEPVMVKS